VFFALGFLSLPLFFCGLFSNDSVLLFSTQFFDCPGEHLLHTFVKVLVNFSLQFFGVPDDRIEQPLVQVCGHLALETVDPKYVKQVEKEISHRNSHHPNVRKVANALCKPSVLNCETQ
jgi:hypothetical protein